MPSRFGYLRSDMPNDPSSENQADVLVDLLAALKIDRLPVLGDRRALWPLRYGTPTGARP